MPADITKYGTSGLKGLKGVNQQKLPTSEELDRLNKAYATGSIGPAVGNTWSTQPYDLESPMGTWGSSQYDEDMLNTPMTSDEIQNTRYENQPWYDVLANGVGKMLGTAATTFISSVVGLPYGLTQAANQGRWSALWDNSVTQGLADADKWLEENLTNYKSQEQQNASWYDPSNLFSMNFIADDIIKNAGFTLGAAASMAAGAGAMGLMGRSLGFVNEISKGSKMANNVISALFSATGEGMIEARQGVEERNKLEMQRLDDAFIPERNALEEEYNQIEEEYAATKDQALVQGADGRMYDPAYLKREQRLAELRSRENDLQQRYDAGKQQIEESGRLMGNKILLANQALLTAGNLIQFSKGLTKSFDNARHAAEMSAKNTKPLLTTARRVSNNIKDGYEVVGSKGLGRTVAATRGLITEGSEEMNQQFIQSASGAAYTEKDVNDYWRAKQDPDAYRETTKGLYTLGNILDRGFQESWGDINQWEQFVIGGLTGLAGTYMPTRMFNQDKSKAWYDPRRYGEWSGGAFNAVPEFNKEYNQYRENIDDVNKILASEDFYDRARNLVAHTYHENEKEAAVEANDKKAYKDADDKQNIHDIQAFLRAGKLDDLRAIYNEMNANLSDEDINSIIKSTTKEISAEEDKQQFDANVDVAIAQKQKDINRLSEEIAGLQEGLVTIPEDDAYGNRDYIVQQIQSRQQRIASAEQDIQGLEQQKANYVGKQKFVGPYVDDKGNVIKSKENIQDVTRHNAEELNRRLDSYLNSIDVVNRMSGGNLTKDQEDNLAYLHNMYASKDDRFKKIMQGIRGQLPKKFLLKTNKTPEELAKSTTSTDLAFSRNDNTPDGYVEVDTSLINDENFALFFADNVIGGRNISTELSEEERKKERDEQIDKNLSLISDAFRENAFSQSNRPLAEDVNPAELAELYGNLIDAINLRNEAAEFYNTFTKYMNDPTLVDKDKAKEEKKAETEAQNQQMKNKFAGKTAKQMNQEVADGTLNVVDLDDFARVDLSNVSDEDVKAAQQEAKKSKEVRDKQAALKKHIQETFGESDPEKASIAMEMVNRAALAADNAQDLNINAPSFKNMMVDEIPPDADVKDAEATNEEVQNILEQAFESYEVDKIAQEDIPDSASKTASVFRETTGDDPVTKSDAEVVAPKVEGASNPKQETLPKNPLTRDAKDRIIDAVNKIYQSSSRAGIWRNTTRKYIYGTSKDTYHDKVAKERFGENSIQYKRSKAIWEYLNSPEVGAFDRVDNVAEDRIKEGDTVHFMVKYFPEIYGKESFSDLTDEEKQYSLVILMLNDSGEVLGDLPLAQLEPSYKEAILAPQTKDSEIRALISFQDKVFNAFIQKKQDSTADEMVVDNMAREGAENLNLTFDTTKKPMVSKIKQIMRGVVPFLRSHYTTLNEVANGTPITLGVKVSDTRVALKRGDKKPNKDIVLPSVGSLGQPYMMLPTSSGEQIAVPFFMPVFDTQKHQETEFYRQLGNALYSLLKNNEQKTDAQKKSFLHNLDVLEGMLQVSRVEKTKVINENKDSVVLQLQRLTDPDTKITISVPNNDNKAEVARNIMNSLSGIPINVSLEYINGNITIGDDSVGKRTFDYNTLIGEIADVNLPQNTQHTVNSWFTVELSPSAGTKKSARVKYKTTGKYSDTIKGRNVEVDTDNLRVTDTNTGEIIWNDEDINLMLAEIKANKPQYKDKDVIQVSIGDKVRTYDVKNKKFIKTPEPKSESPANEAIEGSSEEAAKGAKTFPQEPREFQPPTPKNANEEDQTPLDILISWAEGKLTNGEIFEKLKNTKYVRFVKANKALNTGDHIETTKYVDIDLGNYITKRWPFLTVEDVSVSTGVSMYGGGMHLLIVKDASGKEHGTPTNFLYYLSKGHKDYIEAIKEPNKVKTLEEVEKTMVDKGVVDRQTQDVWNKIPDSLKLKLVNEGAILNLTFDGKTLSVSADSVSDFKEAMKKAKRAALRGTLEISEAARPMEKDGITLSRENEREARRWLAKNLPTLSSEERTQFVDKIAREGNNAGKAWGSYRAGVIEIDRKAPMGTVYHEAFHYVMDMILSPEEQQRVLDIAKKEYGETNAWAAGERLANDFRRYTIDANAEGILDRIKRLIRTILDKINRYNRISDATITQLFWNINNGKFAQKAAEVESFKDTQQRILKEIRDVQIDRYAWKNLTADSRRALKESGLSEATYNQMSLEEKEQYVICRT